MYYDEQVINGILCHRTLPNGEWIPFTPEQITQKFVQAKERISQLVNEIEEMNEIALSEN